MSVRARVAAGAAVALLTVAIAFAVSAGASSGEGADPSAWMRAIAGETVDGGRLSLADARGSVVVLNVWASWCAPCQKEQPVLERVWRAQRSKGVRFVGVDVRDARADALRFRSHFGVSYPSLIDRSADLADRLRVTGYPATLIIGRDGRVLSRRVGQIDETWLTTAIASAMASGEQGGTQ